MSPLLEKALKEVVALPEDEQDAIASQIPRRSPTKTRRGIAWLGFVWQDEASR